MKALTLLEGKALLEQFEEEKIRDSKILDFAKRVEIVFNQDIEKVYPERFANKVEVILKNGKRFETRVDFAKGSSENPMPFDEVAQKFVSLAGQVIARKRIDAIIEKINQLEKLNNVQQFITFLARRFTDLINIITSLPCLTN
jgi:aconitate decarboxylase